MVFVCEIYLYFLSLVKFRAGCHLVWDTATQFSDLPPHMWDTNIRSAIYVGVPVRPTREWSRTVRHGHGHDFAPTRSLWSKISGRRDSPYQSFFTRIVRPMNALQLCRWQFSDKRNFVADILQAKCDFRRKWAVLRFWVPLWGLRGHVRWSP